MLTEQDIERIAHVVAEKVADAPRKVLYSIDEAAAYLGRSRKTFDKFRGKIQHVVIIDSIMYHVKDLNAYIESRKPKGLIK